MPRGDRRWSPARDALAVILLLASSALFPGNKEGFNPLPAQGPSASQFAVTVEDLSAFLEPALNMQLALFGIPEPPSPWYRVTRLCISGASARRI
jgi:hypothetical protein